MQQRTQGLYIISVASQILDMHPQTLRKYERVGFIEPPRMGTLRLYSEEDIARLRLIKYLVDKLGLNLAGVELALNVAGKLLALRSDLQGESNAEQATEDTKQTIDGLLHDLGLEVVEPPQPEPSWEGPGRSR